MNRLQTQQIPWKLLLGIFLPAVILLIPVSWFPLTGLTTVEHRIIAIFLFAALFWILEPIPVFATSIVVIVLLLLLVSDSGLLFLRPADDPHLGKLLSYKDIMGTFAAPILLLFLGGFFLALAATKYRLDIQLAGWLLRPFGTQPARLTLGIMIITAVFSMFMSNTATTAMMLSILAPILRSLPTGDRGRTALALAVPIAANLGGIGTPIGTAPNAIALNYIDIPFGKWMCFGVPFVMIALLGTWLLLLRLFPFLSKEIRVPVEEPLPINRKTRIVYLTFAGTVLLWLTDVVHGINAYTVALIPVAVFLAFDIINREDIKRLSWDVLWLVAGGIALGLALEKSGLAQHLVTSIPFAGFNPLLIIALAALTASLMATFMSHTASANLLLPIIAAIGTSLGSLAAYGGSPALILGTTIACSLGMALPISTPPNALAHATGEINTPDMAKVGSIITILGIGLVFIMLFLLNALGFFNA